MRPFSVLYMLIFILAVSCSEPENRMAPGAIARRSCECYRKHIDSLIVLKNAGDNFAMYELDALCPPDKDSLIKHFEKLPEETRAAQEKAVMDSVNRICPDVVQKLKANQ